MEREQRLPADPAVLWDFIASPRNLRLITPEYLGFQITSPLPDTMYPGMLISYKVRPLLGIAMTWLTEITQVRLHEFFIDEQRLGPYKIWHHEHHLQTIEGGVLMLDRVTYSPPLGFLGDLANILFIKRQLKNIFDFRFRKMEELFGKWEAAR